MADGVIHRCTKKCPYNKKCFVCKTETEVSGNVVVLHKCAVTKEEFPIVKDTTPNITNSRLNNIP